MNTKIITLTEADIPLLTVAATAELLEGWAAAPVRPQ